MKSASHWTNDVLATLRVFIPEAQIVHDGPFHLISCDRQIHVVVHLLSLNQSFTPSDLIAVQGRYRAAGKFLIHLWEDIWRRHKERVADRMRSILGLNTTIYARNTRLGRLTANEARDFLETWHLQGFVHAKYFYSLSCNQELMAVAAFSRLRPMPSKGSPYTSAELVRFASKSGYTITGGLSRLIKHFMDDKCPDDLMTYADRDWSAGEGYTRIGFEQTGVSDPIYLCVDPADYSRHYIHRMKGLSPSGLNRKEGVCSPGFISVFTTGNLKYHLYR